MEITEFFLRQHKNKITQCLYDSFNIDVDLKKLCKYKEVADFIVLLRCLLEVIVIIPDMLCRRNPQFTETEWIGNLSHRDDYAAADILNKNFKSKNFELALKFLDLNMLTHILGTSSNYWNIFSQKYPSKEEIKSFDEFVRGLFKNKGNSHYLKTQSKFTYIERICLVFWMQYYFNKQNVKVILGNNKTQIIGIYKEFWTSSWFALLGSPKPVTMDTIDCIINDYTTVTRDKEKFVLKIFLITFANIIVAFRVMDKDIVETDEREHLAGFVLTDYKYDENLRSEIAADYLINNYYLDENNRQNFIALMSNSGHITDVDFLNGLNQDGKKSGTGGKAVVYWIVRYIKEPNNLNGKCKNGTFDNIAEHCVFNGNIITKDNLSDTGRKSPAIKDDIIKSLTQLEKERGITEGLVKFYG